MKFKIHSQILGLLLLCGLGFAVYSNTFQVPFQFDDQIYINDNYVVKSLKTVQELWQDPNTAKRWVGFLSFALSYAMGGEAVLGYHVVNFCIHLFNVFLVYWFMLLLLSCPQSSACQNGRWRQNKEMVAFLAAALFLVHPVQTQAVTFISQRLAAMVTFFYMLAVCLYWKVRIQKDQIGQVRKAFYMFGILLCGILGYFTKENIVTLPVMLLLLEVYFQPKLNRKGLMLGMTAVAAVIALAYAVYPQSIQQISEMQLIGRGPGWKSYLLTQFRVLMTYLRLMILPVHQNLDYDYPLSHSLFEIPTALSFLALVMLWIMAIGLFKKNRLLSFGIVWFFITIAVESSFIPLLDVIFEHRLYLPSVGLIIFGVVGLGNVCTDKKYLIALSAVVIGVLSWLAYQRNAVWRSPVSLWEDAVQKSPLKDRPYINLGMAYYDQKEYERALEVLNRAVEISPQNSLAILNRANVYRALKDHPKAYLDYHMARKLNSQYGPTYYNWGNLYFEERQFHLAEQFYNKAANLQPHYALAYFGKGNALKAQRRYEEAREAYKTALDSGGPRAEICNNLANAYKEEGRYDEAIVYYSKAIEVKPDLVEAYNNRATLYNATRQYDLALSDFSYAIQLNPQFALLYYNRGNLFASFEKWTEAIESYTRAIELEGTPEAYLNRGLIYRTQGQCENAIADFTHILNLEPRRADVYLQRAICYEILGNNSSASEDVLKAQQLGAPVSAERINNLEKTPDVP